MIGAESDLQGSLVEGSRLEGNSLEKSPSKWRWTLTRLCTASGIDRPIGFMYCMYPHPWAFNEEEGELLVTWSENWPGGVVGAKVKLSMGNS